MSFQASSRRQGDAFEALCNTILTDLGFSLGGKLRLQEVGVEIDQTILHGNQPIWIEYKGSTEGKRPGLLRTDSMKKAICNGALVKCLKGIAQYWVVASHLPVRGSSLMMAKEAQHLGYVDRFVHCDDLGRNLR